VRKTSPSEPYNERLRRQAKKQDFFCGIDLKNIYVPRVVDTGEENGLFRFDMEYSPGLGMVEFLSCANPKELKFVGETLSGYLWHMRSMSRPCRSDRQVISKIDELKGKTRRKRTLDKAYEMIESKGLVLPKTMCHGDLTLANVLFQRNRLCLVDFLDSYVDSYLCDLAKLKQDLFYLWTPASAGLLGVRVAQSCDFLWCSLEEEFRDDLSTEEFMIIDMINLLRIEPYIRTTAQRKALEEALRRNDLYEDTDSPDGGEVV
jgi:hypothetical protein